MSLYGFFDNFLLAIQKKIARLRGKTYVRRGKCSMCGFCCTMVTLFIEGIAVKDEEEFNQLREVFPEYDRFYVRGRDMAGHLLFTCKHLTDDYKCGDHLNRPQICRDYPNQDLLMRGGKLVSRCTYKFIPVEDFVGVLKDVADHSEAGSGAIEEMMEEYSKEDADKPVEIFHVDAEKFEVYNEELEDLPDPGDAVVAEELEETGEGNDDGDKEEQSDKEENSL